mgnify:CR=1 FL=1
MKSITGKFTNIKTITSKKSNITNYKSLITFLGLFEIKYSEDNNDNFIIDLTNENLSHREMDALTSAVYMFCTSFSVDISTI